MLGRDYENQQCSIARALEVIGERWTVLILRDVFMGVRRFDVLQRELGIARNVLTARLERLVAKGILERAPYGERPVRYEYRLTEKGLGLWPVLEELRQWGDRYEANPDGPPTIVRHQGCGGTVGEHRACTRCGAALGARDVRAEPGPGAPADHPLHVAREAVA